MDTIARPFGILLLFLYNLTKNYLLAIIIFTVLVKLMLLPFQMKSKKGMMRQQMLQPQLQELQKKHGSNQQKLSEEMQKLYREAGVSPMSGCLWSLLPLPIMIALYQAIRKPLTVMMGLGKGLLAEGGAIYERLSELGYTGNLSQLMNDQISATKFISEHFDSFSGISDKLQPMSFNIFGLDLSSVPSFRIWSFDFSDPKVWLPQVGLFLIPILAALFMWLSMRISTALQKNLPGSSREQQEKMNNSPLMLILGPGMSLWFAFMLPAAMGVYWIVNTVVSSISDIGLTKLYEKTMLADFAEREAARKAREAELEAKRAEAERRRAENVALQTDNTSKRKQQQKKKQEQAKRDLEWRRAHEDSEPEYEPSRVGHRRYARGRAYDPDRFSYNGVEGAVSDTSQIDEGIADIEEKLELAAHAGMEEPEAPEVPESDDNDTAADGESGE